MLSDDIPSSPRDTTITKSNYRKLSRDIDFLFFYHNPNRCPSQKPNPYPNPNHNLTDVIKINRFQPKGKL